MNRTAFPLAAALLFIFIWAVRLHAAEPTKVSVCVRSVATDYDVRAVRAALDGVAGVKFQADDIFRGERGQFGHYFSPSFVIELEDLSKTDVGGVAEAVSKAPTSKRDDIPPSLNLVLYDPLDRVDEESIMALRQALSNVNGVEAQAAGGIGGMIPEGWMWVRLEAAGGASLSDIREALQQAELDYRFVKP